MKFAAIYVICFFVFVSCNSKDAEKSDGLTPTSTPTPTPTPTLTAKPLPTPLVEVESIYEVILEELPAISEGGYEYHKFKINLKSQPTSDVRVSINIDELSQITTSTVYLDFTTLNWQDDSHIINIRAIDDNKIERAHFGLLRFLPMTSADLNYSGVIPKDISIPLLDNDVAEIRFAKWRDRVREGGLTSYLTITLSSRPTANVTMTVNSSNEEEGIIDKNTITITPEKWNTGERIIVTGVDDDFIDGNTKFYIELKNIVSEDQDFNNLPQKHIEYINEDNDSAGVLIDSNINEINEGESLSFPIRLNTIPSSPVTFRINTSNMQNCIVVGPSQIRIQPEDWDTIINIGIESVDDRTSKRNQYCSLVFSNMTSDDIQYNLSNYNKMVSLKINDNDPLGIEHQVIGTHTSESGDVVTVKVKLKSQPTSSLRISVVISDWSEASFYPSDSTVATYGRKRIYFSVLNWNTEQTLTIFGRDDTIVDPSTPYNVKFEASSLYCTTSNYCPAEYTGFFDYPEFTLVNLDND